MNVTFRDFRDGLSRYVSDTGAQLSLVKPIMHIMSD